ncbi:hypothetical protein [Phormidesmis sp. 146-33]
MLTTDFGVWVVQLPSSNAPTGRRILPVKGGFPTSVKIERGQVKALRIKVGIR